MKPKTIAVRQEQVVSHSYPADKGTREFPCCASKRAADVIKSYPADKGARGGCSIFPLMTGGKGVYIPYNKTLTQKARENRKNPTPAEKKLWYEVLGNKRLNNLKFTRQKPLDKYIVDFYCAELMLAIEIDGDTHAHQEQYDKRRTEI